MEKKQLIKKVENWFNEIKELKNLDNVKIKHSFNTKKKVLIFSFSIIDKKIVWTRGSSNRTKDNKRIFYIDYDNLKKSYVKEELVLLQEQYDLGNVYIFESSKKGFHAISFSKFSLKEFVDILENSSCDYAFKNMPHYLKFTKYWVLRNFSKGKKTRPKFKYCIKGKTDKQESNAHFKYFKILYPKVKFKPLTNSDDLEEITIIDYPTATNV